jgi:molybdopterin-guanine dinucleotide biosynthesis protein A
MDENTELAQFKQTEPKKGQIKPRTAIVLAGGRGCRIGLVEKAFIEFEGKTIIQRLLESLFKVADEVILSVRDSIQKEKFMPALEKLPDREIRFCFDTLENAGPLEGIRAGLLESRSEYSFVCAGDMPFVNFRVVNLLLEKAIGHDAALPGWEKRKFEPLHAVYSTRLIPEIEKAFVRGEHSVLASVFEMPDVVVVEVSEIRKLNPELSTFANINTIEDMKLIIEDSKNPIFFD